MTKNNTPRTLTVQGAYGRRYKTKAEVQADWDAGKDFQMAGGGSYLSKRDADRFNIEVWVRYDGATKKVKVTS